MGYYSSITIDEIDNETTQKKEFKENAITIINNITEYENKKLKEFLQYIIPNKQTNDNKECYFLFLSDENGNYTNIKIKERTQYIETLLKAAKTNFNIFYYPTTFEKGKAKNENAGLFQILFIDIDETENKTTKEILETYKEWDYIISSGHGLHLYKITPPQTQAQRIDDLEKLTVKFKGDMMNLPACHYIRLPTSNNIKKGKEATRGYFIKSEKPNYIMPECENITLSDILEYRQTFFKNKANKAMETRQKNGTTRQKKETKKQNKKPSDEEKHTPVTWEYHKKEEFIRGIPNINKNIIMELENYAYRNQGYIEHRRIYTHLFSNYAKKIMTIEDCKKRIKRIIPTTFFNEAEQIINQEYNNPNTYKYKFTTIATLLEYTENDYTEAFSPYFKTEYDKTKKTKKYRAKISKAKKEEKQNIKKVIQTNPEIKYKEFEQYGFNISKRTFYNYKNEIRRD